VAILDDPGFAPMSRCAVSLGMLPKFDAIGVLLDDAVTPRIDPRAQRSACPLSKNAILQVLVRMASIASPTGNGAIRTILVSSSASTG
jgi:hypothetical protein